jgi:hypothetical protein
MAIVPWGVVMDGDTPRVLRWAAVRSVQVDFVHAMDSATPFTRSSLVTVRTEREAFAGRAAGAVSLERLEAHVQAYADEAARPLASSLDGSSELGADFGPFFEMLLAHARHMEHSADLTETGYRGTIGPARSVLGTIREALGRPVKSLADPRALACVLAGELGDSALVPLVGALSLCPHPGVAAVARAAAVRLGAPVRRIGTVDEVSEFLTETDTTLLERWAERPDRL